MKFLTKISFILVVIIFIIESFSFGAFYGVLYFHGYGWLANLFSLGIGFFLAGLLKSLKEKNPQELERILKKIFFGVLTLFLIQIFLNNISEKLEGSYWYYLHIYSICPEPVIYCLIPINTLFGLIISFGIGIFLRVFFLEFSKSLPK